VTETGQSPRVVVTALGLVQILTWGSSFYFPAVFAGPIAAETGWPLAFVVGGVSIGLLVGGLISPQIGRLIGRHGGRLPLSASSVLFAAGLAGIGLAPSLPLYLAAWAIVGLGMGAGLYDAAFAALSHLYGGKARASITTLTLIGGFASTICFPFSAFLLETIGWRGACFVYAGLHLAFALPLHLAVLRPAHSASVKNNVGEEAEPANPGIAHRRAIIVVLALILSLVAGIGSIMVVHLLTFLQARGIAFAAAVSLGMLLGPAQVGARLIERLFGQNYHPLWTLLAATALMCIGLLLLLASPHLVALAIILYAAGYGISWIARGTVPLAIFGARHFPVVMGRLALPSLIAQALAPTFGAILIERTGVLATIAILAGLSAISLALMPVLWRLTGTSDRHRTPA